MTSVAMPGSFARPGCAARVLGPGPSWSGPSRSGCAAGILRAAEIMSVAVRPRLCGWFVRPGPATGLQQRPKPPLDLHV